MMYFLVAICSAQTIGNHKTIYDAHGMLLPWTSWQDALDREMKWYLNCPIEHGYPRFVHMTFIAGYALALLYEETKDEKYLKQALQNARVLAANMRPGDDMHSPWPFRADYRTGEARGPVSGNMAYILRLFDRLLESGYNEFAAPRDALWDWIE